MANKTSTIKLSFPHPNPHELSNANQLYRVEQVTDSVEYSPNQSLTRREVETLCESKSWRVTVGPVR